MTDTKIAPKNAPSEEERRAKKREKNKRYRERHLEQIREKDRARGAATRKDPVKRVKRLESQKKYNRTHAEQIAAKYEATKDERNAKIRADRAANPEKYRAYDSKRGPRDLTREQRDRANAQARERWANSPDGNAAKRAYACSWKKNNKERNEANRKEYLKKNPDKVAAWDAASKSRKHHLRWYAANPEKARRRQREYYQRNPDAVKAAAARSRAKRQNAPGRWTAADIRRIFAAQKGRCAMCRVSIRKGYHIDHIVALANGGTNWPRNLQLLCEPCNLHKHDADPLDFARRMGKLL